MSFEPRIPMQWEAYSFKVNFRGVIVKLTVKHGKVKLLLEGNMPINVILNGEEITLHPNKELEC